MGSLITIIGVARVIDDSTGQPLVDPKLIKKVARLKHTEDTVSDYFGDQNLIELGVKGGELRLSLDEAETGFLVTSTFKSPRLLDESELEVLVRETLGQWSDGIGEACFDNAAMDYGLTFDLVQAGEAARVTQVDDGKPVKEKEPLSAKAVKGAEVIDAIRSKNLARVQELLQGKIDLNQRDKQGRTFLSRAAETGQAAMVEILLNAGADPNTLNKDGSSALMKAAIFGENFDDKNNLVAKKLLEAGADPNLRSESGGNWSTLSWALVRTNREFVQALLAAGADPNARDSNSEWGMNPDGMTPLMRVTDPDMARLLLEAGADPNLRSDHADWPTAALYIGMIAEANNPESPFGQNCLAAIQVIEEYTTRT